MDMKLAAHESQRSESTHGYGVITSVSLTNLAAPPVGEVRKHISVTVYSVVQQISEVQEGHIKTLDSLATQGSQKFRDSSETFPPISTNRTFVTVSSIALVNYECYFYLCMLFPHKLT